FFGLLLGFVLGFLFCLFRGLLFVFLGLVFLLKLLFEKLFFFGRRPGSGLRRRRGLLDFLRYWIRRGLRWLGRRRWLGFGRRLYFRDFLLRWRRGRRRRVARLRRVVLAVVGLRLFLGFRIEVLCVLAALLQAQKFRRADDVGGDCRCIGRQLRYGTHRKKRPSEERGMEKKRQSKPEGHG